MEQFDKRKYPKTYNYVTQRVKNCVRHNCCNAIVLDSDLPNYKYQCMHCDEDLLSIETHIGEPYTESEFNELCLQTRDLLLLEN